MSKTRLAVLVLAVSLAVPALAEPPLWVIKDGKTEIFLFGQMGVPAGTQWQSPQILQALDKSTEVWTENPQGRGNVDPALTTELNRNAQPLSALLNETDLARLQAVLKSAGISSDDVNSSNAYVIVEDALEKKADLDTGNLPEKVFAKRAAESGKPIHSEFESVEAQLRFSAALPGTVQAGLIKKALDDFDAGVPALNERIEVWKAGSLVAETAYVEHTCSLSPEVCRAIGTERNTEWVKRIKAMLSKPGTYFVCAGIDHFVGSDGIIAQLQAAHVRIRRL